MTMADAMRKLGVPMICGARCSGHNVTKHVRVRFMDDPPVDVDPLSNDYACTVCGHRQNVAIKLADRMCFSAGNPHARTHNEWVVTCGKLEDAFLIADRDSRLWRFGFWCLLAGITVTFYFTV